MAIPPRSADTHEHHRGPTAALPRTLAAGLVVVLLEALALLASAALFLVELLSSGASDVAVAVFLVLFAAGIAAALVGAARSLRRGRRGGRAPVLGWQVLQGATALAVLQVTGAVPVAVWTASVALASAAVVVVLMLTPSAVRFTTSG